MRYLLLIALTALTTLTGFGQVFPFPGPGGNNSGPPPSYSGPGDIASGALAWWGLRAYSLATAGTKAANVCNASDANCADVNTLANGDFDVSTAQGAPLSCGGAGGTCTIKTLYDQSGSLACTGSVACSLTQATIASRPTLTFSCLGALPCMTWTSSQVMRSVTNPGWSSSHAQPFSGSAVGERTGSFTSFADIVAPSDTQVQLGFANSANSALLYAGSIATATAADSAWHALQGLWSGASSVISVDGSASTVNAGTTGLTGAQQPCMGSCNNGLTGKSTEAGVWASDISSSFVALSSNQHSYWGF